MHSLRLLEYELKQWIQKAPYFAPPIADHVAVTKVHFVLDGVEYEALVNADHRFDVSVQVRPRAVGHAAFCLREPGTCVCRGS